MKKKEKKDKVPQTLSPNESTTIEKSNTESV